MSRRLLLLSSSKAYGYGYLEYPTKFLRDFYKKHKIEEVTLIPYAVHIDVYDKYTKRIADIQKPWGVHTKGIHESNNPIAGIQTAQCIIIPGGNAFVLLKNLWEKKLIEPIRKCVLSEKDGVPLVAISAGTTVAGRSIHTSNSMPIVQPPTFSGLNLVPFDINPHYNEMVDDTHVTGVSRDMNLQHFVKENQMPVVALKNGSMICTDGDSARLIGDDNGWLLQTNKERIRIDPNSDISYLLNI